MKLLQKMCSFSFLKHVDKKTEKGSQFHHTCKEYNTNVLILTSVVFRTSKEKHFSHSLHPSNLLQ